MQANAVGSITQKVFLVLPPESGLQAPVVIEVRCCTGVNNRSMDQEFLSRYKGACIFSVAARFIIFFFFARGSI